MKLYGLIGYPLGHSFSKQYFTEKFEREGIEDAYFESFPIPTITEFPNLLAANPQLLGMGVTIPFKEQVLQFVDQEQLHYQLHLVQMKLLTGIHLLQVELYY